ncbi:alpha/beta fold hydrolase [Dactylosporangium cerinum]|uniref:Alpha/beta fold hydrolase n=1 Tax=Dactylosporangium cerinum TaxID=1434730 RepID=A0ABV9WGH8_9ACTN
MSLHVYRFGPQTGRAIVAVHGLKGYGGRWRVFAEEQLSDFQVIAPDLRGHGLSPGEPPWTLEQHAQDVLDVLDRHGLGQAPVLGHSLGATVAVYLARLAPERVDRLVLLDPGMALPGPLAERRARDALYVPTFDNPEEAVAERARFWPREAHRLVREEVANHLGCGSDRRWRWRYSVPAAVTAYSELARPAVTPPAHIPTLLAVAGRHDAANPSYPDACRRVLNRFAVVELDCGHHIHLERPVEAGRLIRDFLAEAASGPPVPDEAR